MVKPKIFTYTSIILLSAIIVFGFSTKVIIKDKIVWGSRDLIWPDFVEVAEIEGDFDASVLSGIYVPKKIDNESSLVYAFMDPNQSKQLGDSIHSDQLLIHEQYHFNITEYCARLLRKAFVEIGETKLTTSIQMSVSKKIQKKKDSLQYVYDSVSNHNMNYERQRFWELTIDQLLRETEYYSNPDLYSYYSFTKGKTEYYRKVYMTLDKRILTSYPEKKENIKYGECYQVIRRDDKIIVKHYLNGELTSGGNFETAITVINRSENKIQTQYRNPDSTYNNSRESAIIENVFSENGDILTYYYNEKRERVNRRGVYETHWKYIDEKTKRVFYLDQFGNMIANEDGIYVEKRTLDSIGRTIKVESFDRQDHPENDSNFISKYEYSFDENNNVIEYHLYDENGNYATHLESFNLQYLYNERGLVRETINLDLNNNKADDKNGTCVYKYLYDNYGNITDTRKYNSLDLPVLALDEYFQRVTKYDSLGRQTFNAQYYPNYVLRFNDNKLGATRYKYPNDSTKVSYNIDAFNRTINSDYGIAIIKEYLNEQKRVKREVHFGFKENFAKTKDGIVEHNYLYDVNGNILEETTRDSLGQAKAFDADVATVRWEYDNRNNKLKTTYFNTKNELAKANQNITYNGFKYDDKNVLIERTNYDSNCNPKDLDGIFKTTIYPNRFGKDSIVKYYGMDEKLINGASIIHYAYNKYGSLIKESYFDSMKSPVVDKSGVSVVKYFFNEKQQYLGYANYDIYEKPVNDSNGIFKEKKELNKSGFMKTLEYFDKTNQPVIGVDGYHKLEYKWDENGEQVSASTYDTDKRLLNNEFGIALTVYYRHSSSIVKSICYYDERLQPTVDEDGIAEYHYHYSLNGLFFLDRELDVNGKEVTKK